MPAPARPAPGDLDEDEALKAQLLAEVVEHARRETRAVMLAKVMQSYASRPFIVALIGLFALGIAAYSYVTRSEWVFGAPVAVSAQRESHLRFAMFLTMQRVLGYRDSTQGVLPASLEEVAGGWPGVSYHVIGDTVAELRALDDAGQVMTLRSDRDARAFLDLSPNALRRNAPAGAGNAP